jgi:hypothetical protein
MISFQMVHADKKRVNPPPKTPLFSESEDAGIASLCMSIAGTTELQFAPTSAHVAFPPNQIAVLRDSRVAHLD